MPKTVQDRAAREQTAIEAIAWALIHPAQSTSMLVNCSTICELLPKYDWLDCLQTVMTHSWPESKWETHHNLFPHTLESFEKENILSWLIAACQYCKVANKICWTNLQSWHPHNSNVGEVDCEKNDELVRLFKAIARNCRTSGRVRQLRFLKIESNLLSPSTSLMCLTKDASFAGWKLGGAINNWWKRLRSISLALTKIPQSKLF